MRYLRFFLTAFFLPTDLTFGAGGFFFAFFAAGFLDLVGVGFFLAACLVGARGAGLGVQLVTPFGPIGLDYAYGFDKTRPGWQLHFRMGQGY